MQSWTSPDEELIALREGAARASCVVTHESVRETVGGLRAVARVICPDGWAAARLLVALAESDARRPDVRELALILRASAPDDDAFARTIHGFVRERVRFVREAGEVFTGSTYTLLVGAGDCDDHARLAYALARAGGLPVRMAFLAKPHATGPSHAVSQLCPGGRCAWAETTVDAGFGEHPLAAARRLGLTGTRPDIATEVTTMSDKDLPPARVSTPQQIARDAQALERLGYICDADGIVDAYDERFMKAVRAFQEASGGKLTIDGLIGPKTRRAIASQLPLDEFGMGYLGATSEPKRTRHLSSEFFRATEQMAQRFRERGANVTALDLLNVWLYESGIGLAKQGHGGLPYYGLNMMHVSHLGPLGWKGSAEQYRDLDPADQVTFVERFYQGNVRSFLKGDWSKLSNATALYLMNFLPAYSEHADEPDFVLTKKGDSTRWYESNPSFDPEGKGWIQVSDLTHALERAREQNRAYWAEVVARAQAEGGTETTSALARLAAGAAGLLVILAAAGLAASIAEHGGDKARVRASILRAVHAPLALVRR